MPRYYGCVPDGEVLVKREYLGRVLGICEKSAKAEGGSGGKVLRTVSTVKKPQRSKTRRVLLTVGPFKATKLR